VGMSFITSTSESMRISFRTTNSPNGSCQCIYRVFVD
jgi:hypothetical protein